MVEPTLAIGVIVVVVLVGLVGVGFSRFRGSGSSATDLSTAKTDDDSPGALAAAAEDLSDEDDTQD